MDENEKTIIVDGIELPVDTYFDAEEEEDVRRILYDWSCYDKYVSMCIIDFENETVNETDYVEDKKQTMIPMITKMMTENMWTMTMKEVVNIFP